MQDKKFEYEKSENMRARIEKPEITFHDVPKHVVDKIAQLSGIKVNHSDESTTYWVTITTDDLELTFFGKSD